MSYGCLRMALLSGVVGLFGCDRLSTESPTADLSQGLAWLDDGRLDKAETLLAEYLKRHPESAVAHNELRWLYFNQFRARDVERLVLEGLQQHPGEHEYLLHAMLTQFRPQLPQEGLAYLEQIEQKHPGQFSVMLGLGYAYWQLGELPKAREFLEAALALDSRNLEVRLIAAEFLMEQTLYDSASELLGISASTSQTQLPEEQTDDRWWWLSSRLAEARGELPQALQQVEQAARLRPFEIKYIQQQGLLLKRLGQTDVAVAAFRRANELEANQMAMNEIVLSGAASMPTPQLCSELAERYEFRGQLVFADGWRQLRLRLIAGSVPNAGLRP